MQLLTREEISEIACDDIMFLGTESREFDSAIIGMATKPGTSNSVLVYDVEKIMECLVESGMDQEDAEEWYSYNISGAYMGEYTPMYMHSINVVAPRAVEGTGNTNIIPFPSK